MILEIEEITPADRGWMQRQLTDAFGSPLVASRGVLHAADALPGWIARLNGDPAGLLTFHLGSGEMEIVALVATVRGHGVARALWEAARARAAALGLRRVWLVTTNDNLPAQRLYEKLGMRLAQVDAGAIAVARRLKPEIPLHGVGGAPIMDEWVYELLLDEGESARGTASLSVDRTPMGDPWRDPRIQHHTRLLLGSFRRALGRDLLDVTGDAEADARRLFDAPFVVVSHTPDADPILNYGNRAALTLWKMDWPTLCRTPSRMTAEPVAREERREMLARAAQHGYIDDYRGVRIASDGQRFEIEQAVVWNLLDEAGHPAGQAATFAHWRMLEP